MTTALKLEAASAQLKKISINVLGKDADNTLFTLPLEGIELTKEQLNAYFGARTFEAWFDQRKDGSYHPMAFWALRKDASFEIDDEFTTDALTIELSGKKLIEFETEEADQDDEESEDRPAAKINALRFTPAGGGVTKLSLHLQVRPGIGKDNLALQEHQFRQVKITLGDLAKVARKNAGAQQDLPLTNGNAAAPTAAGEAASNGKSEGEGFAEGARKQVEAFNAKKGQVVDGRSERVKHNDRTRGAH